MTNAPLDTVPDWAGGDTAVAWLDRTLRAIGSLPPFADGEAHAETAGDALSSAATPLGRPADAAWRRFALALFAADLACYQTPDDQVSFDRLLYVVGNFPEGFRVWWRCSGGEWLPVGYAGWYPISEQSFRRLEAGDPTLADRLIPPLRVESAPAHPFIYIFNYSIDASSRKSPLSRRLLKALSRDLSEAVPSGLAAIAVSNDGIRVAERLGLARHAQLETGALTEWICIGKPGS